MCDPVSQVSQAVISKTHNKTRRNRRLHSHEILKSFDKKSAAMDNTKKAKRGEGPERLLKALGRANLCRHKVGRTQTKPKSVWTIAQWI